MDLLNEHLAALMAAGLAALVFWVRAWVLDLWQRHILENALGRAVGLALSDPEVRRGAVLAVDLAAARGAAYMQRCIPDTLRRLGAGPVLTDMVRGEIGRQLAGLSATRAEAAVPRTPVLFEEKA